MVNHCLLNQQCSFFKLSPTLSEESSFHYWAYFNKYETTNFIKIFPINPNLFGYIRRFGFICRFASVIFKITKKLLLTKSLKKIQYQCQIFDHKQNNLYSYLRYLKLKSVAKIRRAALSKLGIILTSICLLDLIGTIFAIHFGYGKERNPILAYFFERWGLTGLALSKILLTIVAISIFETILKFNLTSRQKVEMCYKIAIWGYLLILIGSIAYFNL